MSWTATITKYNDDNLTMDVVYTRDGYEPVTVGALLPPMGADLQQHLASYAPTAIWAWADEQRLARQRPPLGVVVQSPEAAPAPAPAAAEPRVALGGTEVSL